RWAVGGRALLQVRLLGPVDVIDDGKPRPVRGLRRKAIVAALALHDGKAVSISRLVEIVWAKPDSAAMVNTLQTHLSYLRGALGREPGPRARRGGWAPASGRGDTEGGWAGRGRGGGGGAAAPAGGVGLLDAALALWRGRSLADVPGLAWMQDQAARLDVLRLQ